MNNEIYNQLVIGDFHDRLFAFMKVCGIKSVNVNYSGGGDSGGVDNIDIYFDEKSKLSLDEKTRLNKEMVDQFEDDLAQPLFDKHGGFADGGGYSVNGVVTYDANEKSVRLSGTDHHYGDDYYDEEGNEIESEEKETSIDWEENVLIKEEVEESESGYDFLCFYANHILKSHLPEEFHNRVLIAAVDGDLGAKKYIKGLNK